MEMGAFGTVIGRSSWQVATGVGIGFDPPRQLRHGDLARMEIDALGRFENPLRERGA
jgi:2-keto-4-pentenoate hydratase/2-oxohepta-3-ene-1,7-dioic acid hydratase in catechol pathway